MLPSALDKDARKAELIAAFVLGKEAAASNPLRQGIATYLACRRYPGWIQFFRAEYSGLSQVDSWNYITQTGE